MKSFLSAVLVALVSAYAGGAQPNFLVVLVDDLGFSDLGCYGSEIDTPNLDRLAANGLRFTQFYNTAKCHSSRVSLLSGRWCRQAGDEALNRAVIIPETLGPAGYFTAMSGKWHLTKQPTDFGFQRYFGHLSGACSYYKGDNSFRLNGEPWIVPAMGFYTTIAKVDYAIRFLDEARGEGKPWFLYLAFNAPHAPLQPLEADYKKYLGRYDEGWDRVWKRRVGKQATLGLFGKTVEAAPRPDHIPAWEDLSPEIRDWEARRMAAYAGMIDRLDREMGRLVADLEAKGDLENTLILFFSDNGACPYDRVSTRMNGEPYDGETSWSDSTGWAWARNSPFRYYKQNQFEGGVATPAIAHWPAGLKTAPGAITHSPAHLVDVLPTLLDLAGCEEPAEFPGREITPLAGVSLRPLLQADQMGARPPIHFLFSQDRGLRDGDWKLVSFKSGPWELYNLAEDRAELNNLAERHPRRVKKMAAQWHQMAEEVLRAPAKERGAVAAAGPENSLHKEWSVYSGEHGAVTSSRGPAGAAAATRGQGRGVSGIRARAGTLLRLEGNELVLECSGDDPGLAFEQLPKITAAGPYKLEFEVRGEARGNGKFFWVTDPKVRLPQGERVDFPVTHDGEWRSVTLAAKTAEILRGFRLDPCAGPGTVALRGLRLLSADGRVIASWP
jgi:arylsulfatase A-like enzyme